HVLMLLFMRSVVVAVVFLVLLPGPAGGARLAVLWAGPRPGLLWLRSVLGGLAWALYFFAVAALPLPVLTTLMFTMPLFVALLAGPLLGERVGARRAGLIVLGFTGVLAMLRPGGGLFDVSAVLGLLAALSYALMMLATRALSRSVSSATMVLHLSLALAIVSAAALPWTWRTPDATDLGLMLAIGGIVGIAQFSLAQAYRFGAAALVAPFDYVRLLWASAFGWWLWNDLPGGSVLAGALFVVASGLLLLVDERGRSRR
ncbi:MAG: DMT family transporter, partial [Planctomycetes bacterium]|nr:DMT family transporter [Planctomycetota bacterium]